MGTKEEEERLKAEMEGRSLQQAAADRRTRISEYERQMISGQKRSPVAQRIIDLSQKYAEQLPPKEETLSAREILLTPTELSIVSGVEVVADVSMFELSSEKKPEE